MADILTPSPPALGDSHLPSSGSPLPQPPAVLPAPPPLEVAAETPKPKSSLYNDKSLAPAGGAASSSSAAAARKQAPPPPAGHVSEGPAHQSVGGVGAGPHSEVPPCAEPPCGEGQPASPSPDPHPGPILYPSVRVTHIPNPDAADDGDHTTVSPPVPPAAAGGTTPPPQPPTPPTPPPKPNSAPGGWRAGPPSPPPKPGPPPEAPLSPSVPMIQEPTSPLPHQPKPRPAPDSLSYLESASMMSGTLESLSGLGEDGSSLGSDSEVNGLSVRRTDKYGFLGGTQFSESGSQIGTMEKEIRVEVARQREMKWLEMFKLWDKWVKHQFPKVKMRCRKGIPSSLRARAWQLLSNSEELLLANPGKFEELEREPGEAKWLDIIEKDLHRQFPFHEMFAARGGHGQQDLYRILKAYTVYRPDEGYCQAQAPVAAVLLMHMPAEHAFWCLVQICEKYLPGYYSAGLEAIQLDGEIFFSLLRRTCPMAYRHLKKFKIDPILYMTEWFMCIFSRTLPWACVLRVWDMFFCEGVKIVFRVGLVLLKQMLGSVDKLRELQGMYETMERLRNISPDMIREELLVQEVIAMPVTEALLERESGVQVRKWREARGALGHQPGRRLHGTRAVYELKRRAASISSGGSFSFLGGSSSAPPPGPLRASSSLLSLQGFRKARVPFMARKKGSFSGPAGPAEAPDNNNPTWVVGKPPKAPAPQIQSPLVVASSAAPAGQNQGPPAQGLQPQGLQPQSPQPQSPQPQGLQPQSPQPQGLQPQGLPPQGSQSLQPQGLQPQGLQAQSPQSPQGIQDPQPQGPQSPQSLQNPQPQGPQSPQGIQDPQSPQGIQDPQSPQGLQPQGPPPPNTLAPASKTVSEHVTPTLPSPTANNVPLPPFPPAATNTSPRPPSSSSSVATAPEKGAKEEEEEGKKKRRSKEDKRKEREEEKQRLRERKERERQDKERQKREKERLEKERKKEKGGKKKDRVGGGGGGGGGEVEGKSGGAAPREPA